MVSDILNIENFLTPGTIIVTDGRGANAEFLKITSLELKYFYIKHSDQHIFYLTKDLRSFMTNLNFIIIKF